MSMKHRLTQYAHGGGCACKIPPGELEEVVAGLVDQDAPDDLLIGLDDGDDAAVVRARGRPRRAWRRPTSSRPSSTTRTTGAASPRPTPCPTSTRWAALPLVAVNLLGWPRDTLPMELAREVLRGGLDVAARGRCHVAGGHSVDDPEPKYGMAVTGLADPDGCCATTPHARAPAVADQAARHRRPQHAAQVDRRGLPARRRGHDHAERRRVARGARARPPVRHRRHRVRAARAPVQDGAGERRDGGRRRRRRPVPGRRARRRRDGFVSGGTRRNLAWVTPHTDFGGVAEDDRLLLADAQTSGGLLVAGEIPGATVIGELTGRGTHALVVR